MLMTAPLERIVQTRSRLENTVLAHKTAPVLILNMHLTGRIATGLFALLRALQKAPSQTVLLQRLEMYSGRGSLDVR
jgi:hypothetical protein